LSLLANLDNLQWEPVLLILGTAAGLYCLPSIVALVRRHPRSGAIAALNILGGWTVVGWLAAFIWSSWSDIDPDKRRHVGDNRRPHSDTRSP